MATFALSVISDDVLVSRLVEVLGRGWRCEAELLRYIGELDARRLYLRHACSSLFVFCRERLNMSEGAAAKRIRVARAGRELPAVLAALKAGRVHLTGLYVLAPHLTSENAEKVLERATGRSKREIEGLVAELAPRPDVKPSIHRVSRATRSVHIEPPPGAVESPKLVFAPAPTQTQEPATIKPLAPARYHVSFTGSEALKKSIDKAKELAGFGVQVDELVERAMELLVADLEKKRLGVAGRKAPKAVDPRGRRIAKAIRREVFERDQGRCTYVDGSGHRCSTRMQLHLDHVVPHARGGMSTAENLRLRCGPHNQLHADECFGPLFMKRKRTRRTPTLTPAG